MSLGADRVLPVGIKNHKVGITANGNRTLARVEAEELRRSRRNQFHEAIHAETSLRDAAGVDQAHAVLHTGTAVGNLGEIAAPQFLLFLETEWTVIGGDHLEVIALQTIPEF